MDYIPDKREHATYIMRMRLSLTAHPSDVHELSMRGFTVHRACDLQSMRGVPSLLGTTPTQATPRAQARLRDRTVARLQPASAARRRMRPARARCVSAGDQTDRCRPDRAECEQRDRGEARIQERALVSRASKPLPGGMTGADGGCKGFGGCVCWAAVAGNCGTDRRCN